MCLPSKMRAHKNISRIQAIHSLIVIFSTTLLLDLPFISVGLRFHNIRQQCPSHILNILCYINGVQTAGPSPIISTKAFNFQLRGRCNGHGLGGKAFRSAEGILQRIAAVEVLILHLPNTQLHPKLPLESKQSEERWHMKKMTYV